MAGECDACSGAQTVSVENVEFADMYTVGCRIRLIACGDVGVVGGEDVGENDDVVNGGRLCIDDNGVSDSRLGEGGKAIDAGEIWHTSPEGEDVEVVAFADIVRDESIASVACSAAGTVNVPTSEDMISHGCANSAAAVHRSSGSTANIRFKNSTNFITSSGSFHTRLASAWSDVLCVGKGHRSFPVSSKKVAWRSLRGGSPTCSMICSIWTCAGVMPSYPSPVKKGEKSGPPTMNS